MRPGSADSYGATDSRWSVDPPRYTPYPQDAREQSYQPHRPRRNGRYAHVRPNVEIQIAMPTEQARLCVQRRFETGRLLHSPAKEKGWFCLRTWFLVIVTFLLTLSICAMTMPITWCNDPADPAVRDRIRREHEAEQRQYEHARNERDKDRIRWKLEEEQHSKLLHAWQMERVQHEKDLRDRARREEEQHAKLLRDWQMERDQHEKDLRDRARREDEERSMLNLAWTAVEAHHCSTYATKEYTAQLTNIPANYPRRLEACRKTPLVIHGVSLTPTRCEEQGQSIIGYWQVNQNEPDCVAWWNSYKDQGCTSPGSGKKRIEHHLQNLPAGGDWREFCATTPARFLGMEFIGAQECFQSIWGVYGQWEIDDTGC